MVNEWRTENGERLTVKGGLRPHPIYIRLIKKQRLRPCIESQTYEKQSLYQSKSRQAFPTPFSVLCSLFSVLRSPFSVLRSPFSELIFSKPGIILGLTKGVFDVVDIGEPAALAVDLELEDIEARLQPGILLEIP